MPSVERRQTRDGVVWRIRYRHQGHNRALTFNTKAAATKWAATMDAHGIDVALAVLEHVDSKTPTVASQVAQHIDNLTGVQGGTKVKYRGYVRRDIETHKLGHIPVDRVTEDNVKEWINDLEERGLSGKSIRNIHSLLSATFTAAVRSGLMPVNVAKGARLPKVQREPTVDLTQDEFRQIVALTPEHYRPLVILLGTTGMRIGEATALKVADVNLRVGEISVSRAWKYTGTAVAKIGPPKSEKGTRMVAFPNWVTPILEGLVAGRKPSDWLFTNTYGNPVSAKSFHDHPWTQVVSAFAGDVVEFVNDTGGRPRRVVTRGDGRRPRVHDLRHSFAKWAIESGNSLAIIQVHMGHEQITTTIGTYGRHVRAGRDAMAGVVQPIEAMPQLPAGSGSLNDSDDVRR